jgi:hypothetical protein
MVKDAWYVRGHEIFTFAYPNDNGRAGAGSDDLVGLCRGENAESEGTSEALDGAADRIFKQDERSLRCRFR